MFKSRKAMSTLNHTILFFLFNLVIGSFLVLAGNYISGQTTTTESLTYEYNNYSDVSTFNAVDNVKGTLTPMSEETMNNAHLPTWFTSGYLLIAGVWGLLLIVSWVRGN